MKTAYFDTGVVSKWYVPEPNSPEALAIRSKFRTPVPFTPLHRLELAASWHAKVHRGEVALDAVQAALDDVESDVTAGVLSSRTAHLDAAFALAERLARRHGKAVGARSLDILHVALALELGETHFVTGDRRQATLASACALKVTSL